jgi:tetratricopeptide (TPR) repeat protein
MKLTLLLLLFFATFSSLAQEGSDQQLAQHYYSKGEFEKAVFYYERLLDKDDSKFNFMRYYDCLVKTDQLKDAEKVLKKQISAHRYEADYKVMLGEFYEETNNPSKAIKMYEELIDDLTPNANSIIDIYNSFKGKGKNDFALKTLEKGRKLLKGGYPLHFQFADLYGSMGETEKMLAEYLDLLDFFSGYQGTIQTVLSRQIDFSKSSKEYELLRQNLLERVQKNPDKPVYAEMLIWLFIQSKNFNAALVQVQALDKRQNTQGKNVFDLGIICVENNEFETARKAFRYVIDLGNDKVYYYNAENALLNTRFLEVTTNRNYSKEELATTLAEYESALLRVGKTRSSLPLIIEKAHIQAFYANQSDKALELLNDALTIAYLTDMQKADIKMEIADIDVLHGDIWEASIYYMQVDSDFKFEPVGHEAKFKNARIFYYDGEFDFAQSQLSVLKESTSKLIANDAMKLSLLITDNFGIDSNYTAMNWFASADLLIEQHRYNEAFALFDSIMVNFPYHSLGDEILIKKSGAMQQQGKWSEAAVFLEELLKYYGKDILADDALFQLAEMYEVQLKDSEKAAEYYKRILFDYPGSLYVIDARKRFRILRGDTSEDSDLMN